MNINLETSVFNFEIKINLDKLTWRYRYPVGNFVINLET